MCDSPITLKDFRIVPCSRCPTCRSRRVSAWSFRLMREDRVSTSSHFVTLTYDSKIKDSDGQYLPSKSGNGFNTLSKRHIQLFFKRLRALPAHRKRKIKYYIAGEYGKKGRRPHYHAIIFGSSGNQSDYAKAWQMGNVVIGDVREASVGYTLKYISKGKTVPLHRNDDRLPEFSTMSQRLGAAYLTAAMIKWHRADPINRVYCTIAGGKKVSMPRYFKDRIFTEEDRRLIADHYQQFHDMADHLKTPEAYEEYKKQLPMKLEGKERQSQFIHIQNEKL